MQTEIVPIEEYLPDGTVKTLLVEILICDCGKSELLIMRMPDEGVHIHFVCSRCWNAFCPNDKCKKEGK